MTATLNETNTAPAVDRMVTAMRGTATLDGGILVPNRWDSVYWDTMPTTGPTLLALLMSESFQDLDDSLARGRLICDTVGGLWQGFTDRQKRAIGTWPEALYRAIFEEGTLWVVLSNDPVFSNCREGEVVVSTGEVEPTDRAYRVYFRRPNNTRVYLYPYHVIPESSSTVEEEAAETSGRTETFIPDMVPQADLDAANAEVTRLRSENARLRETWQSEITRLGERLMTEADRREWCSEYDDIVDGVNSFLTYELPVRECDIDVTWQETYTVTVTRSGSTTARRGDEQEAADSLAENADTLEEHELISLLRENGSHSYDDSTSPDWSFS